MTKGNIKVEERVALSVQAIRSIRIQGFKSHSSPTEIEIRPLTLLAGANSSGKSSAVQPLLLLKQTLESDSDPGPLHLDGPNISFNSSSQILSPRTDRFDLRLSLADGSFAHTVFGETSDRYFTILETTYGQEGGRSFTLTPESKQKLINDYVRTEFGDSAFSSIKKIGPIGVFPSLGFLEVGITESGRPFWTFPKLTLREAIRAIVHVPALRSLGRNSPRRRIDSFFRGTFEGGYTLSLIHEWQEHGDDRFRLTVKDLRSMALTWRMHARMPSATEIELLVGRSLRVGGDKGYVNIADVGIGLSQVLPVVVSLQAALPSQLVYIEQPELHLHPRAQVALAELLVNAANRGVRVLVETHSESLLLGIQIAVAEGRIDPSLVKLHWFSRDRHGYTIVDSEDLDETGAFGSWPEDFSDISLSTERRYLDAAGKRLGLTAK